MDAVVVGAVVLLLGASAPVDLYSRCIDSPSSVFLWNNRIVSVDTRAGKC